MLYTPLLPGARRRLAGAAARRRAAARRAPDDRRPAARARRRRRPVAQRRAPRASSRARPRRSATTTSWSRVGSVSRTLPVPGLAEHALGFKSLPEAIGLRNRLVRSLEIAETIDDLERRKQYLNYVFVGAGYAGLEGIAELQDFAADLIDLYPRCRVSGHALRPRRGDRPRHARDLRGRSPSSPCASCARAGSSSASRRRSSRSPQTAATLSDGEVVPTRTLVWTAGVKPHPVVAKLGLPLSDRGRIVTDEFLQVAGPRQRLGDRRRRRGPRPAKKYQAPSPPTAQHAIRQGRASGATSPPRWAAGSRSVRLQDARRVRRHGARQGGRRDARHPLARPHGLAARPDLPPGDDAGPGRRARLLTDWNVGLLFGRDHCRAGPSRHAARGSRRRRRRLRRPYPGAEMTIADRSSRTSPSR